MTTVRIPLFDTHAASFPAGLNMFVYAVASDGKRFLVCNSVGETASLVYACNAGTAMAAANSRRRMVLFNRSIRS